MHWEEKRYVKMMKKNKWQGLPPGGTVVKYPGSQCRGPRLDPWVKELDPACYN